MKYHVRYRKKNLRIVETVYSIESANEFIEKGNIVIFETMKANEELYSDTYIYKNVKTGHFLEAPSRKYFKYQRRGFLAGKKVCIELPESEFEEVSKVSTYARKRTLELKCAAYVLPNNISIGETVYVKDLIEDIILSEFLGSKIYAEDGIAVWDGKQLQFKKELYDSSRFYRVG